MSTLSRGSAGGVSDWHRSRLTGISMRIREYLKQEKVYSTSNRASCDWPLKVDSWHGVRFA